MKQIHLIAIGILGAFVLGAATMWLVQSHHDAGPDDQFLDDMFGRSFFDRSHAPFEEMERMQERMDRMFGGQRHFPDFDRWFDGTFGDFPLGQIESREDTDAIYYVLDVSGNDVNNLSVTAEDGYVTINAELTSNTGAMTSTTSINQRFPVPPGVDPESVELLHKDDEILIRFRKVDR